MPSLLRLLRAPQWRRSDHRALPPLRAVILNYALDWIVTIVAVALFAGITNSVISGFKREFSLTDTSIQHTYTINERITFGQDTVIAGVFPLVVIIAVGFLFVGVWDVHHGVLGLILSCAMTTVVTEIVKPIQGAANASPYGLSTVASACTVTSGHIIDDGFKSFPSGHTSFAFAGLGFLALYLAGKTHLFDCRGRAIHAWISLAPLLAALLVAVSRTMDYRHHATDVLAGGILGALIANLSYFLYYPMLTHPESHLPHLPIDPAAQLGTTGGRQFARSGGQGQELPTVGYPLEEGSSAGVGGNGLAKGANGLAGGYSRVEAGRRSVEDTV